MKTQKLFFGLAFLVLVLSLGFTSCSKDEPIPPPIEDGGDGNDPPPATKNFDTVIAKGGTFEPTTTSEELKEETESNEIIDGTVWNCTTKTYSALSPGGGDNGFPLFNPNASVIYPGSLLQGKSLNKATPDVIAVERAGGTISYDLNNGNLASSFEVEKVAKSSIQDGMNNIIASAPSDLPANFTFNYSQVQSEQALAFSMGIDYSTAFTSVSADFSFSSEKSYNRILVELNQSFYTMSFDIPTSVSGLFAESVSDADLEKYVQPGNPATYISDVTYGRIYYMLIESTSSYTEMEAAVSGEFNAVAGSGSIDIDGSKIDKLSELKVKVMAFGGDAGQTLLTAGNTNIGDLVELLAKSTTISTGLPISYVVRSVENNQIVGVQLATEYDVTECTPGPPGGEPVQTAHWKGELLERMGPVGAAYPMQGTGFVLISKDGKEYMHSYDDQLDGPFPVSQLATEGEYPFGGQGIGAAANINGNDSDQNTIMVISSNGLFYSYITGDRWQQAFPIEDLAPGNPFLLNGIGAMFFVSKDPAGPSKRAMINRDGTMWSIYNNNPRSFTDAFETSIFTRSKFDSIGAAMLFLLGETPVVVYFDGTGTRYVVNSNDEQTGPFDL
ncbi:MAG: thiol-activated cytolysin family protein [Aurantibacter sp.]